MAIEKVLVIGQDEAVRALLSEALQRDYDVECSATVAEARQRVASERFDLVFADSETEDFDQFTGKDEGSASWPCAIVVAPVARREPVIDALQSGAFAYILKPFTKEEVAAVVARAADYKQAREVCRRLGTAGDASFLGDSFASSQLRSLIAKVAQTNIPVLVRGAAGAGKELVARLIHRQGSRAEQPFLTVDCAAIGNDQLEQVLFGWSAWGPSTQGQRPEGALELSAGGSVLIDEVSLLPMAAQTRLLKAIQEKKFQRTDGTRWIPLEARIIATTTRDLEKEVKSGQFNEPLFHVLNVVPIWVPSLKERPQDVRSFANNFVSYYARKHGVAPEISRETIDTFEHAEWPCNVRQLKSAIEQAVVNPTFALVTPDFNRSAATPFDASITTDDVECLDEIEKRHILAILARCNGNRTLAAKRLGISIRTIRNKLKLYRTQQPATELLQAAA